MCALDSHNGCRYAEAMQVARPLLVLMCAAIAAVTGFTAQADDAPVLAVLEYSGGLLPKRTDIRAKTGLVKSPFANMPRAVWVLREGETLSQEHSPATRFIQLFQLSGNTPQLLCNLVVRYTRSEKGWRPAYLLLQLPPNIWDGEKFIPRPGMGTREPVQIVNAAEPTTDGFYRSLSFGLASGPTRVTAWEVQ
jgi:hypothetical protein